MPTAEAAEPSAKSPGTSRERLRIAGLAATFMLLLIAGYYAWLPLVLLAAAPLALLCEAPRAPFAFACVAAITTVGWLPKYYFFTLYSPAGAVIVSIYHGLIVASLVVSARWWRRKLQLPLCLIFPAIWTGGEYLRLAGPAGLPLGILGPSMKNHLWAMQVCDLGGLYLLSFAVATAGSLVADLLIEDWPARQRLRWKSLSRPLRHGIIWTVALWVFIATYGACRLKQAGHTMKAGPVVTVVQPDTPTKPGVLEGFDPDLYLQEMLALSSSAVEARPAPDLIVWPEAPATVPPLNREFLDWDPASDSRPLPWGGLVNDHSTGIDVRRKVDTWVHHNKVDLLLGTTGWQPPAAGSNDPWGLYNTTLVLSPDRPEDQRQNKMRLFPIGEYLPWKGTFINRLLARVLQSDTVGFAGNWYSAGDRRQILELTSKAGTNYHYAISVCSEILFAPNAGTFIPAAKGGKPIDFVVNNCNDGVFRRNHALVYHSYLVPFRAVEARVGIARSSNTGISEFVKPTGEVYGAVTNALGQTWTGKGAPELDLIEEVVRIRLEHGDELATNEVLRAEVLEKIERIKEMRAEAGVTGQSTQVVYVDSRRTLYSRTGDVFARTMLALMLVGLAGPAIERLWRRAAPHFMTLSRGSRRL